MREAGATFNRRFRRSATTLRRFPPHEGAFTKQQRLHGLSSTRSPDLQQQRGAMCRKLR